MKQIKLTKKELERLLVEYSLAYDPQVERLIDACKDLGHASEDELLAIYNAFCRYLDVGGLSVYRMDDFNSIEFESNVEQKKLTENVNLDDLYFSMCIYSAGGYVCGYESFNDLHSFLKYRITLSLNQINEMLEFTFEDEEEGEEDD